MSKKFQHSNIDHLEIPEQVKTLAVPSKLSCHSVTADSFVSASSSVPKLSMYDTRGMTFMVL